MTNYQLLCLIIVAFTFVSLAVFGVYISIDTWNRGGRMTDKTPTERLRKLLDACEVSWTDYKLPSIDLLPAYGTVYKIDEITWVALENPENHSISVTNFCCELSPEQVIKATLGYGMCKNISDPPEGFLCSECKWGDFAEPSHLLTSACYAELNKGPRYCPNCGRRVMG